MPSWLSCFSINKKRNGNQTDLSTGATRQYHREFNNTYIDGNSTRPVYQLRRDFLDSSDHTRINRAQNQQEYSRHDMINRLTDDSEEMYNRYPPPPVVNYQRSTSAHEPIIGTRPPLRDLAVNQTLPRPSSVHRNSTESTENQRTASDFSPENKENNRFR